MKNILVVDDNIIGRRLATVILRDHEFTVTEASSGEEALAKMRAARFDCILMDISMPGLSGTDVVQMVRADPALAALHVVGYTAHAMSEDIKRILACGFDDILIKPISGDKIVAAMSKRGGPAAAAD